MIKIVHKIDVVKIAFQITHDPEVLRLMRGLAVDVALLLIPAPLL